MEVPINACGGICAYWLCQDHAGLKCWTDETSIDPSPGCAVSKTIPRPFVFRFSHSVTISQREWYSSSQFDYLTFWIFWQVTVSAFGTWVPSWQSVPQKTSNLFMKLELYAHTVLKNTPQNTLIDLVDIQFWQGGESIHQAARRCLPSCANGTSAQKWPFEDCLDVARHQSSIAVIFLPLEV